ncbi:hypothetical protein [Paraglaciecola marina]|nr:hypothetical protein [Paraglaciecola marina]
MKKEIPIEEAMNFIREQKHKHFDPELVDLFEQKLPAILEIKNRWVDD